jgi:4-amino-4-deoxy-L-arabinose transferase-like glycosyltransferase
MNSRHLLIVLLLGAGGALVGAGLWRLIFSGAGWRIAGTRNAGADSPDGGSRVRTGHKVLLTAILAVALIVRLEGLERRGMTHVEVFIPGIPLPAEISAPPPRVGLLETVAYHFHVEPHPQGYYFFMWGWSRVFGTSLTAIRLPSVLLGVAAVFLVFLLGARLFDPVTGLVAAALLALNGHQVYWSQHARMYMPSCAFALGSTLLLVSLLRDRTREPLREAAYVAITWLMLFTQLLTWGLLGAQIVAALCLAKTSRRLPRILQLQGVIAMLGTPLLAHAVYRSRASEFLDRNLGAFLMEYLGFGFLFEPDGFSLVPRDVPMMVTAALVVTAMVCLVLASRRPARLSTPADGLPMDSGRPVGALAVGIALFVAGLSQLAWQRQLAIAITALVPLMAAALLVLADARWSTLQPARDRWLSRVHGSGSLALLLILSIVPMLLLSAVHLAKPVLTSRASVVYTPFLLVAVAAGLAVAARRAGVAVVAALSLLAAHGASLAYYRSIPEPNDYRSIAERINRDYREGDLIFIRAPHWMTTPLFYHLTVPHRSLVASGFAEALEQSPQARVWVPQIGETPMSEDLTVAVKSRRVVVDMTARRTRVRLFVP